MQKNYPPSNSPTQASSQNQQSNWPFLVIAVLMAVVLWLFVRTGAQPTAQRDVKLPISVTNAAPALAIAPDHVEVQLEGTSSMADRLSPDEVAVIADLAGHHEGDLVTLTVVPPQGFKVLSTSITQVRVVEKRPAAP